MRFSSPLLSALLLCGCQSTPGFHWSFGVDVPPTLNATAIAHPTPLAMQTTYMVEGPPQTPVVSRQIGVYGPSGYTQAPQMQMQQYPPPIVTRPIQRETIPTMPRENCGP